MCLIMSDNVSDTTSYPAPKLTPPFQGGEVHANPAANDHEMKVRLLESRRYLSSREFLGINEHICRRLMVILTAKRFNTCAC